MKKYRITTDGTKYRVEKRFWRPFPKWLPLDSSGSEANATGYCESGYIPPTEVEEFDTMDAAMNFRDKLKSSSKAKWLPIDEALYFGRARNVHKD